MKWSIVKKITQWGVSVLLLCIGLTVISAGLMYFFPGEELKHFNQAYRLPLMFWRFCLYAFAYYLLRQIRRKNAYWQIKGDRLARIMVGFITFVECINLINMENADV